MAENAAKLALILATQALAQARAVAKQEGQRGKDGEDGKDATPEQIELSVRSVFAEHAESLRGRDGENGKNVTPEEAETVIRLVVAEIADSLRGKDGENGEHGRDGQNVTTEQADALIRSVVAEIAPTLKGKDGRDGVSVPVATVERMVTEAVARAVTVGEQGKPGIVWRGKYDRGTQYYKDDAVRFERSSYIALRDNLNDPPALIGDAWELLAQGGEDGKPGKDGVTKTIVSGAGGGVRSIQQGTGVIVDNTDPRNPIISATGGGAVGIAVPAGQTITAYQVVTTNLAGDIVTADAGTVEHQGRVIGVALNSAITGATVAIADSGVVTNAGWSWTPHAVLYVGLNGTISTEQVGAFSQNLGYAISANEIFIRLGRSVVRG